MRKNPLAGVVFGALAIVLAVYSIATQTAETAGAYQLLNYGLIVAGAAGIIGSLIAYSKKKDAP